MPRNDRVGGIVRHQLEKSVKKGRVTMLVRIGKLLFGLNLVQFIFLVLANYNFKLLIKIDKNEQNCWLKVYYGLITVADAIVIIAITF